MQHIWGGIFCSLSLLMVVVVWHTEDLLNCAEAQDRILVCGFLFPFHRLIDLDCF